MTPEAKRAVDEVAAARAKLDDHNEQALVTTRSLNQDLRAKAITAINDQGASKYAVARAARRSRTTVYHWLKAEESSRGQERVVADSAVRREVGESSRSQERVVADSAVRREVGESSRSQERVVADSAVRREVGESSRSQERVVADSAVRREVGESSRSQERREVGELSRSQERVVADSVVRVSTDKAKQDRFVACAIALVERFDDPRMKHWEKRELLETTAKDLGVQVREMTRAVTLARNVKRGLWQQT